VGFTLRNQQTDRHGALGRSEQRRRDDPRAKRFARKRHTRAKLAPASAAHDRTLGT
jgi:hypothetical protein